jgi:hypothetical protein
MGMMHCPSVLTTDRRFLLLKGVVVIARALVVGCGRKSHKEFESVGRPDQGSKSKLLGMHQTEGTASYQ